MLYRYIPTGVCSREIMVDIDDDNTTVLNVAFVGGCSGNTQGVAVLAQGKSIDELIIKLKGINCGRKRTSCPDQLAVALQKIKKNIETGEGAFED